jgi:restriction system protein
MSKIWVVRAGRGGAFVDTYLEQGVIALGMSQRIGAEALGLPREELQDRTARAHPEWSGPRLGTHVGQLHRFLAEIKVGDEVATYDPGLRRYLLGVVDSDARWEPDLVEWLPYVRTVKWDRRVARDSLSVESRNSLGAIQSIFRLNADASSELRKLAVPLSAPAEAVPPPAPLPSTRKDRSLDDLREEVVEKAAEFIEDMIAALDPYQMQDFVAGLLRAMGYKTRVSPQGSDRGVDIFASPDGLGLQEPRIFVEVKHRSAPMGSQQIRAFMGGRRQGDRCLYVSTGGFTKDARYEAERSNVPLTLLDLRELGTLLVAHYEALDGETKRLVPLTKLYWPVTDG